MPLIYDLNGRLLILFVIIAVKCWTDKNTL